MLICYPIFSMANDYPWMHPNPHVIEWHVQQDEIDHYNHVNNVAYLKWLERVSWAHSNALGLSIEQYRKLDRGMAITRHEIDYRGAALLGETLLCGTWVIHCDRKLYLRRQFQIMHKTSRKMLVQANTHYACIALSSGRPKRMPAIFADTYGNASLELDT